MITVHKLKSLPPKTRIRKVITLLEEWEKKFHTGVSYDRHHQYRILSMMAEEGEFVSEGERKSSAKLAERLKEGFTASPFIGDPSETEKGGTGRSGETYVLLPEERDFLREMQNLRYALMDDLGVVPADWDFMDPDSGRLSRDSAAIVPVRLYLEDIRSPYNVGSIFRTAEAFGIEKIYLSEHSADPMHSRAKRTSMGCTDVMPWERAALEELAADMPVCALELGGTSLGEFRFPPEGLVVIGSEELGISPEARRLAVGSGGIVSIPLLGAKGSLNVAVAAGILLQSWVSSLGRA